ncbi:MAG: T9SS type A sorting domain-containing protein [Ignavibacteria bacterium]|nr:T9SS type A sorting domain-containing protein [Ignavibacteria bacterium]
MKTTIHIFAGFIAMLILFPIDMLSQFSNPVSKINLIPDVMNKVHYLENNGNSLTGKTFDADSFPVYNGFPKIVTGQSFEGGITCQMDADSELEIVYGIGATIQAWNLDGSNVTGWPVSLSYNAQGAPSYGDIDGDGQAEIVLGTSNFVGNAGAIYAFEKNGTPVTGFPIVNGATGRTIVLADLDNNGALEIISNKRIYPIGEVWVYRGNGTAYPGWPKTLDHVPASSSAVGDITGDGIPEIVSESYLSLYAWDRNGNPVTGFPFTMPNGDVNSYSSPVLADVDGDNIREILFGSHASSGGGFVYILKNNGTILNGWPKQTNWWVYGPPVLGYINGDNVIDIVVGDQVGSGIPTDYVYGWDKDGNVLNGFPIGPINAVNNQITLADLDNDNQLELLIDDNTQTAGMGKYLVYDHDGTPNKDWTLSTTGTSFFNMPTLADINSDGRLDLVGAGFTAGGSNQTYVYVWNTNQPYNAARTVNPVWQFNVRHNGVYGDNNLVGINETSAEIPDGILLNQNYPNPFNPVTKISYQLPEAGSVSLQIYNVLGKLVTTLVNERQNSGTYEVQFDGKELSSGVYFYRLNANGISILKMMTLLK